MNKRNLKRLVAFVLTTVMVVSMMGVSAFAEEPEATFVKQLNLKEGANIPSVEFSFTATPATAEQIQKATIAGVEAGPVNGITINNAKFTAGLNETAETYVESGVIVNPDLTKFARPGIYRYVVEESVVGTEVGFTTDDSKYLDVYVINGTNGLEVASYVLYEVNEDGAEATPKTDRFVNEYDTFDLTLTKNVNGNWGDKGKYFEFTVTLKVNGANDDTYNVSLPSSENSENNTTTSLKISNGTVTAKFYLKNGQAVTINDIPKGATYEIVETAVTGYTTDNNIIPEEGTNELTATGTVGDDNVSVVYTNTNDKEPATGIILTFAPYVLMVLGAAVIGFVFLRRRQREC